MNERKYDNLERMRKDIAKDLKKVEALKEQIREKEEKLKEAEASRVVADVTAMQLSPEQVGAMLDLVKQETERVDSRFLEPACGDRNFVAEILRRKLEAAKKRAIPPRKKKPLPLECGG